MELCSNEDASFNFSHPSGFLHSRRAPQKEALRFAEELFGHIKKEAPLHLIAKKKSF